MANRTATKPLALLLVILLAGFILFALLTSTSISNSNSQLSIVAGENFWGSLVSQLAGSKASVYSVVSDPNADPHEYESNTTDARKVARANLVIENGEGYDDWLSKVVAANPNSGRVVLNASQLVGLKPGQNPHLWYNPSYVNEVVSVIKNELIKLRPQDEAYFNSRYLALSNKLSSYQDLLSQISKQYAGTKVASTEDIFVYVAQATGLKIISPPAFMQAVAEGNDPPASSVATFESQLRTRQPKVLIYNRQTVTPLTTSMKKLAQAEGIKVVGITETIQPPGLTFEQWMNNEILDLNKSLAESQ